MCHDSDYSLLDRPEVIGIAFYPRQDWTPPPAGAKDYLVPATGGISLSARFYPAAKDSPCILFFHGNGEVASDYDPVAPAYNRMGINLFVADYRGYGRSGGSPSFSTMVKDAHAVASVFLETMRLQEHQGPMFLMGRSLGTASALEIAFHHPEHFSGLIIESGSGNFLRVLAHHGFPVDWDRARPLSDALGAAVAAVSLPALILHGANDMLIPAGEGDALYRSLGSKMKRLVIIPRAGHNDIMVSGAREYFAAVGEFALLATGY